MESKDTQALDTIKGLCIATPRLKNALLSFLEEERCRYVDQLVATSDTDYSARCKGSITAIDLIRKKVFK